MRLKLNALFVVLGLVLVGCGTAHDASSKVDFDQSTPDNAIKQMMNLIEKDDFSGVKDIFADSATAQFATLSKNRLKVSNDIRGLPLDELEMDVKQEGDTAVVKLDKKTARRLRADTIKLAKQGNDWKITDANFQLEGGEYSSPPPPVIPGTPDVPAPVVPDER